MKWELSAQKKLNSEFNFCWSIAISKVFFRDITNDVQVAILHQMTDFTVGDSSWEDELLQH